MKIKLYNKWNKQCANETMIGLLSKWHSGIQEGYNIFKAAVFYILDNIKNSPLKNCECPMHANLM